MVILQMSNQMMAKMRTASTSGNLLCHSSLTLHVPMMVDLMTQNYLSSLICQKSEKRGVKSSSGSVIMSRNPLLSSIPVNELDSLLI
jgi:hypothetical protein